MLDFNIILIISGPKPQRIKPVHMLCFSLEVQDSLVGVHVGLLRVRKAKHPTHNSAAIQTPAFITHLSPPPSMLYFHHTLRDKSAPLCDHQDWLETDFLNPHPTGRLEEDWKHDIFSWAYLQVFPIVYLILMHPNLFHMSCIKMAEMYYKSIGQSQQVHKIPSRIFFKGVMNWGIKFSDFQLTSKRSYYKNIL